MEVETDCENGGRKPRFRFSKRQRFFFVVHIAAAVLTGVWLTDKGKRDRSQDGGVGLAGGC